MTLEVYFGRFSGLTAQAEFGIAIGSQAGQISQQEGAIAIGREAGFQVQGENCVAIGNFAGTTNQNDNTIILNASGAAVNTGGTSDAFFVNPIRPFANPNGGVVGSLWYNTLTNEICYNP